MRGLFILFALLVAHVAWAASSACPLTAQEQASQVGEDTCLQIEVHEEQKHLDVALLNLRRSLSPQNWGKLEASQRAWKETTRLDCEIRASFYAGGTIQPFVSGVCYGEHIRARLEYLRHCLSVAYPCRK